MELEITPEPTDEEREAISAALAPDTVSPLPERAPWADAEDAEP